MPCTCMRNKIVFQLPHLFIGTTTSTMSLPNTKEPVLKAIGAVIKLNNDAGVDSEHFTALLGFSTEERGGAAFDKFCREFMDCILKFFSHFSSVIQVRAHRDFHHARLQSIPALWKSFTTSTGLTDIEPLHPQAVSRELFENCMKEFLVMLQPTATQKRSENILADDENALRYASGYVGRVRYRGGWLWG